MYLLSAMSRSEHLQRPRRVHSPSVVNPPELTRPWQLLSLSPCSGQDDKSVEPPASCMEGVRISQLPAEVMVMVDGGGDDTDDFRV